MDRMVLAPRPELIFYDPFSFKTDGPLWMPETFARILRVLSGGETSLYTYSTSTAVRAALLWAGFHVVRGMPIGPKTETTVACTRPASLQVPGCPAASFLNREWLNRWERSGAKFPPGLSPDEQAAFASRIRAHPQFAGA